MPDTTIYRPYSRLARIRIRGRWFEVPENNILLRCFQYIAPEVPYGPFCWNGDCENDRIRYREPGASATRTGLSCQVLVKDGMEIEEISPDLARVLASAFRTPDPHLEAPELTAATTATKPDPSAGRT